MSLNLTLNGQTRVFEGLDPKASMADVVAELGLKGDRIALELNGEIVSRGRWALTHLAAGDKLELVHFVGGGSGLPLLKCRPMPESPGRCAFNPACHSSDEALSGQTVMR